MDVRKKYRMYVIAALIFSAAITTSIMMPFCQESTVPQEDVSNVNALSDSTWYMVNNFSKSLAVEGVFMKDIILNSDSGKISLHSFITKPTLVFRFFDINCAPCIQTEVKLMQEQTKDIADQVILIGSFDTYRALKAYNLANDINLNALQIGLGERLGWEPDRYNSPYYFVLYPGGKASQFFMSVPEYSSYSEKYLEGINRLLSSK